MITFAFIAAMFLGLVLQHFVGAVPGFGSQIMLMPIIFLCGAAALPVWNMLVLAFTAGLMWDCMHFMPVEGRVDFPFGGTILLSVLAVRWLVSRFPVDFTAPTWAITLRLMPSKSSRLMPGLRGTPAVTITTSAPAIAS